MLLHLEPPLRRTRTAGHVLAVEPNSVRASLLRDLLREHVRVHLEVVPDVECAIRSIAERVPDLVITSTFLSPSDEAALVADLRARPGASHVQVIIVPHFTSQDGATGDPPRGFRLLRRTSPAVTGFDLTALRNQILEYLEQARDATRLAEDMAAWRQSAIALADEPLVTKPELRLVHRAEDPRTDAAATTLIRRFARAMEDGRDRRGARRLSSAELPWLWSARLSSGAELKLVDLSNTGVLVETAAKLTLGTTVDLRLVGQDTDLLVPAHVLRSTVSEVNQLGVRYHVAAAFSRELHLQEIEAKGVTANPVSDQKRHRLESVISSLTGSAARVKFEQELRRLLDARDVLIRQAPVVANDGADSVYFSIPGGSGSILQVFFERQHEPSAMEFQTLKAAARLAAAVLEFGPLKHAIPTSSASNEALAG